MAELSEAIIARSLWIDYGTGQWACANIHYYAFESDLLILRNSSTVIEYEIKLSVADWKRGLQKKQVISSSDKNRRINPIYLNGAKYTTRHQYLTAGLGANMFYYIAPQDVLDRVEVPDWAGVIRVAPNKSQDVCSRRLIKKAKKLHKKKASDKMKEKIMTSCYYKYWRNYATKDLKSLRQGERSEVEAPLNTHN